MLSVNTTYAQESKDGTIQSQQQVILEQLKVIQELAEQIRQINQQLQNLQIQLNQTNTMSQDTEISESAEPLEYEEWNDPSTVREKKTVYDKLVSLKSEYQRLGSQIENPWVWDYDFVEPSVDNTEYDFIPLEVYQDALSRAQNDIKRMTEVITKENRDRQEDLENQRLEEEQQQLKQQQQSEVENLERKVKILTDSLMESLQTYEPQHPETRETMYCNFSKPLNNATHEEHIKMLGEVIECYQNTHRVFDIPLPDIE